MKNEYDIIYVRNPGVRIPLFPGQIIEFNDDEVDKAFRFLEMREVPDPDHQSSLDYLKGV